MKILLIISLVFVVSCSSVNKGKLDKLKPSSKVSAMWDRSTESGSVDYKVSGESLNKRELYHFLKKSNSSEVSKTLKKAKRIKSISRNLFYGAITSLLVGYMHSQSGDHTGYSSAQREWTTLGLGFLGMSYAIKPLHKTYIEDARNQHNHSVAKKNISLFWNQGF